MKNLLMPRYRVRRVTDLKADELKRLGIKGLALDIDNTIAYDSVLLLLRACRSGSKRCGRAASACDRIQCPARPGAQNIRNGGRTGTWYVRKADALRFWRAARRMKIRVQEMAVVGDQLLTDIRGGNLCGAVTIFVDPARKEERNVKIFESRRRREQPVLEAFDRLHPTGFYDLDA